VTLILGTNNSPITLPDDMIRHGIPASELTTLAVGGPIATVVEVASEDELLEALSAHSEALCIGGGSNLLVADKGFDGTIIRCHSSSTTASNNASDTLRVEAPMSWDALVEASIAQGFQGLEATSGVPGSVGGAIVQNLGAYGQEIADVVVAVNVWDTTTRSTARLSKEECEFSYRNSRFKHDNERRYVVTSAELQLQRSPVATPRYGDVSELLRTQFNTDGPYPLQAIRNAVLEVRRSKGMLLGASLPSAGSFFTNPILDEAQVAALQEQHFKINTRADGAQLVSAAALMQASGYERGYRLGNAGLSPMHVLALVNAGNAKAIDIVTLACRIRDDVYEKFGITLIPEPVTLGFESNPFA
jgi:UDP-N-acetylmuramate dehydrogenase